MSVIKRKIRRIFPKKVRAYFIRKVTLQDVAVFDTHVSVTLLLKNFVHIQSINVSLSTGDLTKPLSYTKRDQTLTIDIPYEQFESLHQAAHISIIINKKKMIVRSNENLYFDQTSFFSDGKLYDIKADGRLTLTQLFQAYTFKRNSVDVRNIHTSYNHLKLEFSSLEDICGTNIVLLYNHKMIELENTSNDESFETSFFNDIKMGYARVYALKNYDLYPLNIKEPKTFHTPYYSICLSMEKGRLIAAIQPHKTNITQFDSLLEPDTDEIRITMQYCGSFTTRALCVIDTLTGEEIEYPAEKNSTNTYTVCIPLDGLTDNFSRKRFSLYTDETEPRYIQPSINDLEIFGFNERVRVLYQNERIKMWFYKRKDQLVGFKMTRPKVRRMVTEINDFKLSGFITGLDEFSDSHPYLVLEERYSEEQIHIPIEDSFEINLETYDLLSLKSKNKTIIDVFIEIINSEGTVIRKGKIKYKHSDYKKDMDYGRHSQIDNEKNCHYHLLTTTPYDNLKIETFMIPKEVNHKHLDTTKNNNIWLLGERYDTAQDNGYALFKWLSKHTNVEAYYVIETDAKDYQKIKDEKNILEFGSIEHFKTAVKAGVLLGTHDLENLLPYKPAKGFYGYEKTFKVFLQHGVLGRKPAEYHKKYYENPFDLFIVSSIPEKEDIVMKKMGYEKDEVAVTGLSRFDYLPFHNKTKDILLMPTWRDWISSDESFIKSKYYHRYMSLIQNPRLIQLLEDHQVNLNFYPHYRAQTFFNHEYLDTHPRVHFIELGSETVQHLLIRHSLLITDYSSVSFDFTLMNKPVIYYHFDTGRFFKKGKLRPIKETFIGEIAKEEDDLIDLIEDSINQQFTADYTDISSIFKYQDHKNSERIYKAVINKISGDR